MSFSERAATALLAIAWAGCAVSIDGEQKPSGGTQAEVAVSPACRLFEGAAAPTGEVRSLVGSDGAATWIVDGDNGVTNAAIDVKAGARVDDCATASLTRRSAAPVLAPTDGVAQLSPMAVTAAGDDSYLFFRRIEPASGQPFGISVAGYGVARWSAAERIFNPTSVALWMGDRPSYGTAAVLHDDFVYVFGCRDAGFLSAHCAVARAPKGAVADEAAYSYYTGAGRWTSNADDAWPVVENAGSSIDVVWHAARRRFVMVYATPLGRTLHVRTGLAPQGPWSADHEVASCDLPDDAFCSGVRAHVELSPDADHLAVTYAAASLSSQLTADGAWPRLTSLALPEDLP